MRASRRLGRTPRVCSAGHLGSAKGVDRPPRQILHRWAKPPRGVLFLIYHHLCLLSPTPYYSVTVDTPSQVYFRGLNFPHCLLKITALLR